MKVFGNEYKLFFGVGASQEIAGMCRDGSLANINEILTGGNNDSVDKIMEIACIMSKAHEDLQKFMDPAYEKHVLTKEILSLCPYGIIEQLSAEVVEAINEGTKTTIETEEPKNAKGEEEL